MTDEAAGGDRHELESAATRARLMQFGGRLAFPIPDALMAVILALAAAADFLSPEQLSRLPVAFLQARNEFLFILIVEGGLLLMQGTLVDIATRLRKRPPIWAVALIAGAVVLLSDEARGVLRMAWELGMIVFAPLLLSLGERATVLWRMPSRSRIEKIAARALIANRITTGLALFGLVTIVAIVGVVWSSLYDWTTASYWVPLAAGSLYFAIAAYDDARVRTRKFEENPRVLFGFDPMGVKYLEPV